MKFDMPMHCMSRCLIRCGLVLTLVLLNACTAIAPTSQQPAPADPEATATPLDNTTAIPDIVATATFTPEATPETSRYPFSEPGPYAMGKRKYEFEDPNRANRKVSFTVWYPALLPDGMAQKPLSVRLDLAPDMSGAPYPLILSSTEMANTMARYVISHGFTWVSVNYLESYSQMNTQMYSQPLDILFALDRAIANAFEGLQGVIDTDHTGVIGYSFDGYNSYVLGGARIDPQNYLDNCANPDTLTEAIDMELSAFNCDPAKDWDAFEARAGEAVTASDDGLWQPMTDARIRAVMPMAGEGWWLFGDQGLAAFEKPVLILTATQDALYKENVLIYEHLGSQEKSFISFTGLDHSMIFRNDTVPTLSHFAVAFFGYHLQGREDSAYYFSEDFVTQFNDLAWGPVQSQNVP